MTFAEHYADFYEGGGPELRAWRDNGAIDKSNNVVRLWRSATGVTRVRAMADVGCGDGANAARLASLAFFDRLTGYDVSESGIEVARQREIPGATFVHTPDGTIPVKNREFDLAIVSHVVEHVESPRQIIREAARIAEYVIIEVPMESHLRLPKDFKWTSTGHVNSYDPKLIRHLVQSCGLTVLGECVSNPLKEHYTSMRDRKGLIKWWTKELILRVSKPVATQLFTYHGALIARVET